MKIDFILPWVNGNDPKWLNERNLYIKKENKKENSDFRFRDFGTLKYVLRSIEYNCPWYNKIYLITEGHYPEWLNLSNPKIELISHKEFYFNTEDLPVFSSSSIEMNLANIRSLSDNFVYLNDDMIIINPLEKDRFFKDNLPVDFLCHGWIPRNKLFFLLKGNDSWVKSISNNIKLAKKLVTSLPNNNDSLYNKSYSLKNKFANFLAKNIYHNYFWFEHWHHPQAYKKDTLSFVYKTFEKQLLNCSKNKFRTNSDLTQYIYRYTHLLKNEFFPYKHNDGLIKNISSLDDLETIVSEINSGEYNFLCLNDSPKIGDNDFPIIKNAMNTLLDNILPNKSSFEI